MSMALVVAPRKMTFKECGLTRAQVKSVEFPARYREMVKAMKRVNSIDECRTIYAESEAMAVYFKQLNDPEPAALCAAIKARAYRRIGELLNSGARNDAMSPTSKKIARDIAKIPEEEFESALAKRPVPGIILLQRAQVRKERGGSEPDVQTIRAARLKDLRYIVLCAQQVAKDPTALYNFHQKALENTPLTNSERTCVLGLAEELIAYGEHLVYICKR